MTVNIKKIDDFESLEPEVAALFDFFKRHEINHETYEHPAIFTVEEGIAMDLPSLIPGQHGKSLFLTNKDGGYWLVVACEETRVNLKALSDRLNVKRFSFAKPEKMVEILGVTPGSATPYALLNDKEKIVQVVLEENYTDAEFCVFHPLRNTYSTAVKVKDLMRFFALSGYEPAIVPLA